MIVIGVKKSFLFHVLTCFILIFAFTSSIAFGEGGSNVSPPPVSEINLHSGSGSLNNRFIYNSQETGDSEMVGYGYNFTLTKAKSDSIGIGTNLFLMTLESDSEGFDSSGFLVSGGATPIWEIVGGEERDAAGEITHLGFSLALFANFNLTAMNMETDTTSSYTNPYTGATTTTTNSQTMDIIMFAVGGGVVAEIPIGSRLSIMPFFSLQQQVYGTYSVDGNSETFDETPMTTSYGADIILRPFKNAPNWKFSLGTVLQQVEANSSDDEDTENSLIMFSINYEWGKTYSELILGPVTH